MKINELRKWAGDALTIEPVSEEFGLTGWLRISDGNGHVIGPESEICEAVAGFDAGDDTDWEDVWEALSAFDPLRQLAQHVSGMELDDPEAQRALNAEDWEDHWPVVTLEEGELVFTGDVVEGAEAADGYASVANEAMIALDELTPSQRAEARNTGYYDPTA